jgi:dTDP-4-amino-4,6-dideoxygalactose transaminase
VVVAVDLFGLPADYEAVRAVADRYGLLVLEDGAQGFGGSIQMADQVGHDGNVNPGTSHVMAGCDRPSKRACSFGDIATTSFFPAKPLGCYGDGGAVFTDNDEWAALIASYRVHGKGTFKYDNVRIGMNSRLDTVQAAVLQVKLKAFADYELDAVNEVAARYTELLQGLAKPVIPAGYRSSWAQYTVRFASREERDAVQAVLKAEGIPAMVYYPKPLHRQAAFADPHVGLRPPQDDKGTVQPLQEDMCPVATSLCERVLSLPLHPYMGLEEIETVCNAIRKALR